jgi:hypothetical protein
MAVDFELEARSRQACAEAREIQAKYGFMYRLSGSWQLIHRGSSSIVAVRYWGELLSKRGHSAAARNKLEGQPLTSALQPFVICSVAVDSQLPRYMQRYPGWNRLRLEDLREQFGSFDINGDALVDLEEL